MSDFGDVLQELKRRWAADVKFHRENPSAKERNRPPPEIPITEFFVILKERDQYLWSGEIVSGFPEELDAGALTTRAKTRGAVLANMRWAFMMHLKTEGLSERDARIAAQKVAFRVADTIRLNTE